MTRRLPQTPLLSSPVAKVTITADVVEFDDKPVSK